MSPIKEISHCNQQQHLVEQLPTEEYIEQVEAYYALGITSNAQSQGSTNPSVKLKGDGIDHTPPKEKILFTTERAHSDTSTLTQPVRRDVQERSASLTLTTSCNTQKQQQANRLSPQQCPHIPGHYVPRKISTGQSSPQSDAIRYGSLTRLSNNGTITNPGLPLSTSIHSPSSRYRSSIIIGKTSANSRRKQWKKRPMSLDAILMKDKTGNKPILPAPSAPAIGSNDYW